MWSEWKKYTYILNFNCVRQSLLWKIVAAENMIFKSPTLVSSTTKLDAFIWGCLQVFVKGIHINYI